MTDKIQEAIKIYGSDVVNEVQLVVDISDTDGAWSLFRDMGKDECVECIEFIYFENE
jgi:hypothetical protein